MKASDDRPAVLWPQGQRLKDQQVERALRKFQMVFRHHALTLRFDKNNLSVANDLSKRKGYG